MGVNHVAEKSDTNQDILAYYRRMVDRSLSRGDYTYAAKYCWMAYVQAIKVACSDCGLAAPTSGDIIKAAQEVNKLAPNADAAMGTQLRTGFHAARSLYWHLDENDLTDSAVERTIADVMDAINLMQTLFDDSGR